MGIVAVLCADGTYVKFRFFAGGFEQDGTCAYFMTHERQ